MIHQHTHQGPFDPPSQPGGFPTPPGAVPPPPGYGYGYGGNEGYLQPPPPQSYQGYGGGSGYNEGGQGDYYSFNPPHRYPQPPQHIGHEQRYGDDAFSSFLRACLGTLCCCFICQECCFI